MSINDNFEPAFNFITDESSILLHSKPAEVHVSGNIYTGNAEVRMNLAPRAKIYLCSCFENVPESLPMGINFGKEKISSFKVAGHEIDGFSSGVGGSADDKTMTIKWSPASEPLDGIVGNESSQIYSVVFHLFNFLDVRDIQGHQVFNNFDLLNDEWEIKFNQIPQTGDNFKKIKSEGGCHLTHVGCIKKKDQTRFSGKVANDFLIMLRYFLSFAYGAWCEPICPVGLDEHSNRVWESWSSPREIGARPSTWFDEHHVFQLQKLFPGFVEKWKDADWRQTLREIIYWHTNANNGQPIAIDAGIILTQAAIERLSYEYAVESQRLISNDGFKKLRASDKFKLLFSSIDLPIDIPIETPKLKQLAKDNKINWFDAPHAITEVRNSLVHPAHKIRNKIEPVLYEAWNLGLWYLELSILRICGYSGKYSNRLVNNKWVGTIEDVPWKD